MLESRDRHRQRRRARKIKVERRGGSILSRLAPDSPRDSPALLAFTVIFYWVYDVINLIMRLAYGLNRDASESVDMARPIYTPSLPACLVISGIFGRIFGESRGSLSRDILECVNYQLYKSAVLSFHFHEFNERL